MEGFEIVREIVKTGKQEVVIEKMVLVEEKKKELELIDQERENRIADFKAKAFNSVPFNITNVMIGRMLVDLYEELKR